MLIPKDNNRKLKKTAKSDSITMKAKKLIKNQESNVKQVIFSYACSTCKRSYSADFLRKQIIESARNGNSYISCPDCGKILVADRILTAPKKLGSKINLNANLTYVYKNQGITPSYVPSTWIDRALLERVADSLGKFASKLGIHNPQIKFQRGLVRGGVKENSPENIKSAEYSLESVDNFGLRFRIIANAGITPAGKVVLPETFSTLEGREIPFTKEAVAEFLSGKVYTPVEARPVVPEIHYKDRDFTRFREIVASMGITATIFKYRCDKCGKTFTYPGRLNQCPYCKAPLEYLKVASQKKKSDKENILKPDYKYQYILHSPGQKTIGKENERLVRKLTEDAIKSQEEFGKKYGPDFEIDEFEIYHEVIDSLPKEIFNIYEEADKEILNIIHDQIWTGDIRESSIKLNPKTGAWERLPKGWTRESLESFWESLTGDRKHKVTACINKLKDEEGITDAGAFCASLADRIEGTEWRHEKRKSSMKKSAHWVCPHGCETDEVVAIVRPQEYLTLEEIEKVGEENLDKYYDDYGIMIDAKTGKSLGRFDDGTVGTGKELDELAEESEMVYCPKCYEEATWIHEKTASIYKFYLQTGEDMNLALEAIEEQPLIRYDYDADKNLIIAKNLENSEAIKQLLKNLKIPYDWLEYPTKYYSKNKRNKFAAGLTTPGQQVEYQGKIYTVDSTTGDATVLTDEVGIKTAPIPNVELNVQLAPGTVTTPGAIPPIPPTILAERIEKLVKHSLRDEKTLFPFTESDPDYSVAKQTDVDVDFSVPYEKSNQGILLEEEREVQKMFRGGVSVKPVRTAEEIKQEKIKKETSIKYSKKIKRPFVGETFIDEDGDKGEVIAVNIYGEDEDVTERIDEDEDLQNRIEHFIPLSEYFEFVVRFENDIEQFDWSEYKDNFGSREASLTKTAPSKEKVEELVQKCMSNKGWGRERCERYVAGGIWHRKGKKEDTIKKIAEPTGYHETDETGKQIPIERLRMLIEDYVRAGQFPPDFDLTKVNSEVSRMTRKELEDILDKKLKNQHYPVVHAKKKTAEKHISEGDSVKTLGGLSGIVSEIIPNHQFKSGITGTGYIVVLEDGRQNVFALADLEKVASKKVNQGKSTNQIVQLLRKGELTEKNIENQIEDEKEGEKKYDQMAKQVEDEEAKDTLEDMANDEADHAEDLEEVILPSIGEEKEEEEEEKKSEKESSKKSNVEDVVKIYVEPHVNVNTDSEEELETEPVEEIEEKEASVKFSDEKVKVYKDMVSHVADPYVIIIGDDVYTMSENPNDPQGVNQWAGKVRDVYLEGLALVKDIPEEILKAIEERKKSYASVKFSRKIKRPVVGETFIDKEGNKGKVVEIIDGTDEDLQERLRGDENLQNRIEHFIPISEYFEFTVLLKDGSFEQYDWSEYKDNFGSKKASIKFSQEEEEKKPKTEFIEIKTKPHKPELEVKEAPIATSEMQKTFIEVQNHRQRLAEIKDLIDKARREVETKILEIQKEQGSVEEAKELQEEIERFANMIEEANSKIVDLGEFYAFLDTSLKTKKFKPTDTWRTKKLLEKFGEDARKYLEMAERGASSMDEEIQQRILKIFPKLPKERELSSSKKATLLDSMRELGEGLWGYIKTIADILAQGEQLEFAFDTTASFNKKEHLGEELHEARIVRYDPESDLTLAWFGGHGVHAYDAEGNEVSFWNTGDFSKEEADESDIIKSMEEAIKNQEYP